MFFFKLLLIFIFLVYVPSLEASVLDEVKDRGYLICGVSEPRIGFANIDGNNNWIGFDVDMCRAVSSAIFADPVSYTHLTLPTNREV